MELVGLPSVVRGFGGLAGGHVWLRCGGDNGHLRTGVFTVCKAKEMGHSLILEERLTLESLQVNF